MKPLLACFAIVAQTYIKQKLTQTMQNECFVYHHHGYYFTESF